MEVPVVRTQIQLTRKQAVQLKRLAVTEHSSMAALIRRAVDRLVASKGGPDPEEQRMRAIAVAGRFHSGTPDIAEKHDRYLAEAFRE